MQALFIQCHVSMCPCVHMPHIIMPIRSAPHIQVPHIIMPIRSAPHIQVPHIIMPIHSVSHVSNCIAYPSVPRIRASHISKCLI